MEEVVGAFDSAVGGPAGVVPGEDLVGPGDDGVDDGVELGQCRRSLKFPSCARRNSPPCGEWILGVVVSFGKLSVAGLVFAEAVAVAGDVEHD